MRARVRMLGALARGNRQVRAEAVLGRSGSACARPPPGRDAGQHAAVALATLTVPWSERFSRGPEDLGLELDVDVPDLVEATCLVGGARRRPSGACAPVKGAALGRRLALHHLRVGRRSGLDEGRGRVSRVVDSRASTLLRCPSRRGEHGAVGVRSFPLLPELACAARGAKPGARARRGVALPARRTVAQSTGPSASHVHRL